MRSQFWLIIFLVKVIVKSVAYLVTALFVVVDVYLTWWLVAVGEFGIALVLICWFLFTLWALWYFWEYHFQLIMTVLIVNVLATVILWQYYDLVVWILREEGRR